MKKKGIHKITMNKIYCNNSPAKHHQSSLGIGSWRHCEYWAINNSEGINIFTRRSLSETLSTRQPLW